MKTVLANIKWDAFIEGAIHGLLVSVGVLGIGWLISKWIKKKKNN
jgi:hypothetical protein